MFKTITLFIVAVLCLGLGGCGGNGQPATVDPEFGNGLPVTFDTQFDNGVTVKAARSSLAIPYGPEGYVTSAVWYFPTQANGTISAKGVVWLQRGDTPALTTLAVQIAGQTNSIVVAPVISALEIPALPGRYIGSAAMQQAVGEMMSGDRVALATSAAAAGYTGVLPERFLFAGQLTAGGFAAEVAARTVDNGAAANLLGVVMFDGVASPDQFPASLAKLDSLGIPLYQIASPPQAVNHWGRTTEQLVALHPDRFVGVQLDDGNAMSVAITLATGWINDIYDGTFGPTNPFYGIYGDPNDGTYVPNQPIVMGETRGTVLPAPPPVDINQYAGTWYEQGSVKQDPSVVLVNVKAVYTPQLAGSIKVENSGNYGGPGGTEWSSTGSAVPVNAFNTRFNVSLSGEPNRNEPGNYWILDYGPDYSWAIVSNASRTSGIILTRDQFISEAGYNTLVARAYRLGVQGTITPTLQ
jgi:lipocalin